MRDRINAAHGIASIEAPVSGGIKGAREGTLSLMIAGPLAAWDRVRPLIETLGRPFFMGETPGAGQTMKLVNNLLSATAVAATSEAVVIGVKAGLGWYLQWAQGWAAYSNMYAALIVMSLLCSGAITLLFWTRDRLLVWQKGVVKW